MHWLALSAAGVLEAFIPILVIRTESYTQPLYIALLAVCVVLSFMGVRYSTNKIPLGIAYTVWTALGILGTVLVGATLLGENINPFKMICLVLIVFAVTGLRISTGEEVAVDSDYETEPAEQTVS